MTMRSSTVLLFALLALSPISQAAQFQQFGQYEVHYIVFPTMTLKPEIAAKYGVNRAQTLSLLNISVLAGGADPVPVEVSGQAANLLGQLQVLDFQEVREGPAIYYLAPVRHSDEEMYRLSVTLSFPDGSTDTLKWEQKIYVER